jgi:hypothetical protein
MADISLPALESSLAWVDHYTGQRDPRYFHVCALAAAVRELRGENLRLTHESNGRQFRLQQAEAALAELRGRTCDKCKHGDGQPPDVSMCAWHAEPCRWFGFTCGAWAAKEPTP